MIKKWSLLLFLFILLSGCSNITGESRFSEKMDSIEETLQEPDWKKLSSLVDELNEIYEQTKWKIQLLGDEGEYERLQENINLLIVAIEEKDIQETKLKLASIKTFLDDIYSL